MKRLFFASICCVILATACTNNQNDPDILIDKPTVWFDEQEYTLPAAGGDITIPVYSTGIDYATIKYTFEDAWDFTPEGNMVPREGWISLEVIPNYTDARALMTGCSGVKLTAEPNNSLSNRTAWLIVGSYNQTASVLLRQNSTSAK